MDFLPELRTLTSHSAKLCLSVERFLLHSLTLSRGSRLVLAVSGGADSSALAVILRILSSRLGFELFALTINHNLRTNAVCDAAQAAALCERLDIACTTHEVDVTGLAKLEHLGIEDAGRKVRYALFEEERKKHDAHFIALGHHSGDLSEDVLLRLTRGTGWPALGGMPARDDRRHLLRPLLFVQPDALRSLLLECNVTWLEDESNTSMRFKRNRLRHTVLPLLRRENPAFDSTISVLWQLARCDEDYWDTYLKDMLATHPWQEGVDGITLPKDLLQMLHPAARLRLYHTIIKHLLHTLCTNAGQARGKTLFALDAAYTAGRGNTRFQFPGGIEARLDKGCIRFYAEKKRP